MLCLIQEAISDKELKAVDLEVLPREGDLLTYDDVVYVVGSLHWHFASSNLYKPYVEIRLKR